MGLRPHDIDGLSLWQFGALVRGWNEAHTPPDKQPVPEFSDRETLEELGIFEDGQD